MIEIYAVGNEANFQTNCEFCSKPYIATDFARATRPVRPDKFL